MNKVELYKKLIQDTQDSDGFIHADECDSLLFSALIGCVPGVKVNIDAAMDQPGQWFRRPAAYPECYSCGGSKSTISRDMLLGLAWYAWCNKRLDISEGVIKYALKHFMVMGKGVISRTLMTPSLLATFAWISYRLGGPDRWWLRWIPCDLGSHVDDFEAHLQVLHILLRRDLTSKLSKRDAKTLDWQRNRQPSNPLFAYACGDTVTAEMLLDNEKWWPADRLPTSSDRKTNWLPMRDIGSDWEPCDQGRTHSGGDYLFVKWLIDRQ